MASPLGKTNPSVIDRLLRQPHRFAFFQAVRLLLASGAARRLGAPGGDIGGMSNIQEEPIRFRSLPALEFPSAEIVSIGLSASTAGVPTDGGNAASPVEPKPSGDEANAAGVPLQMQVAFWGLVGPAGALPNHYTQLVIDRSRHKDAALRDFLDLFAHRQLSFFYRAWEKHYVAAGYERAAKQGDPTDDPLREALLAVIGLGTPGVRDRLEVTDDTCVYFGGAFVDRPCAESLRQILSDTLGLPTEVLSLSGQWLMLPESERSRIGALDGHSRLGTDTVLGERTWDPISKFRIRIGPVRWSDFQRLMPTGPDLVPTCQLIRSYVGCEFDFDLQMILVADEIPRCQLDGSGSGVNPHLGWNTWLCSRPASRNSEDAAFHHDGAPGR